MSKSFTDTLRYRLLTAAVNMQTALGKFVLLVFEYARYYCGVYVVIRPCSL